MLRVIWSLLAIPWWIFCKTFEVAVMLSMTIIGIPVAVLVVMCGFGLAFAALAMIMIPVSFLLIGLTL